MLSVMPSEPHNQPADGDPTRLIRDKDLGYTRMTSRLTKEWLGRHERVLALLPFFFRPESLPPNC